MACAVAGSAAGTELHNEILDTVNIAIESGVRRMDEFIWPKEEVPVYSAVELPVVDLEKLRKASGEELGELLKDVVKICEEWGFFRLLNHGVSYDMLRKLEEQTVRVFSLPSEVKKNAPRPPTREVGFYSGADDHGLNTKLWWHESLQLLCDPDCVDSHTQKLWPDGDGEEFSSTIKEYMRLSHDLGLELLHFLTTALNIDSSKLLQHCRGSITNSNLRLNHYPICKRPEDVLGLLVHSDDDILTILFEDQVGGLQIHKDNTWLAIKPEPNTLVVNLGDIMQVWSNNNYSSVLHRVAVKSGKRRVSAAFFLCPEPESLIEPASELINAESPANYKGFTFEEYRLSYYGYDFKEEETLLSRFELHH